MVLLLTSQFCPISPAVMRLIVESWSYASPVDDALARERRQATVRLDVMERRGDRISCIAHMLPNDTVRACSIVEGDQAWRLWSVCVSPRATDEGSELVEHLVDSHRPRRLCCAAMLPFRWKMAVEYYHHDAEQTDGL